jgi:hypothetical protein
LACGTWLPVGANIGGLSRWREGGNNGAFLVGVEASLLSIGEHHHHRHWGAYIDTLYETHDRVFRTSAGPELVIINSFPIGFDLGPLIEWRGLQSHVGLRGRVFIPLLFIDPYIGTTYLATAGQSFAIEGSVLLKVPILVNEHD